VELRIADKALFQSKRRKPKPLTGSAQVRKSPNPETGAYLGVLSLQLQKSPSPDFEKKCFWRRAPETGRDHHCAVDLVVCWSPPAGSYAMQLNTDSCSAEHDWPSHSTFLKNGRPEPAAEIMGFGSFANSLFHFDGRLKFQALILNLRLENVAVAVAAYASSASLRFFPFLCNLLGRSLLCCSFPFG
jgi:hypothetical protein